MGAAALLQTDSGDRLGQLVDSFPFNDETDRRTLQAFLQQEGDYAPQSGQIVGILKQMKDTFEANIAEATTKRRRAWGSSPSSRPPRSRRSPWPRSRSRASRSAPASSPCRSLRSRTTSRTPR